MSRNELALRGKEPVNNSLIYGTAMFSHLLKSICIHIDLHTYIHISTYIYIHIHYISKEIVSDMISWTLIGDVKILRHPINQIWPCSVICFSNYRLEKWKQHIFILGTPEIKYVLISCYHNMRKSLTESAREQRWREYLDVCGSK